MDPAMPEETPLPWDTTVGNRFAPFTPDNHSAPLWIASLLGLIYVIGVLLIRLFIKVKVLGLDDWFIVASSLVAVGQYVAVYEGLGKGLGKTSNQVPDISSAASTVFAGRILLLVSIYLAKCSGIFLLRRLFVRDDRTHGLLCNLSLGLIIICGIGSVFIGTVGCPSSGSFSQHCDGQITRWSIVTGLDVATEVIVLVLPPYLVWQLQMKTSYKLRVIAAFCFRILIIVFSVLYLNAWITYTNGPPSPFRVQPVLLWQQVWLSWSLISTTIPNLKAFLQSLSTNWGIDWGYSSNAYGTHAGGAYELGYLKSNNRNSAFRAESDVPYSNQPRGANIKTEITTTIRERPMSGENGSIGSGGSQDLIIRKNTLVEVQSERAHSQGMF
ncbi:hypothetical protein BDV96DRAFT_218452 [Lophiotrema nucula]|uniref:Rhodopsin domain-containing protein n=1 Tax=Lophiotrema nucula TaxID=690887 RepID=A0A6A5ZS72_9PLEO|nr:hypothetical protein BDV96DRAFT_218452 [Lophiotrema nucula]